ncbi:uncharacterized protein EV154DRAFT_503417 [Mucor mucedo]|uniref:uncharacterized protein n=1 Tax=Mucor mucedo TaxID=29922 RepID=UPI00221EBCE4|nr:uncharacterized protein EV154DRAFT_503417 [Mucor mucedo]KAI7892942.1 hypothetical protein EV154DRAFT_503417 [Mucor mucedo]
MPKLIALIHFLTQQEKHIVALDEYMDPTLRKIYSTAYRIFTIESENKVLRDTEVESYCDAMTSQFKKIIHNNNCNDEVSRKRIEKYAEDGISFSENFKRRCIGEEGHITVTPVQTTESKDLQFVKDFMEQNQGKMKWPSCYDRGIDKGLFDRFSSHSTLKMA